MNPRIERDVRLVLPAWLLALVLVTVAAMVPRDFGQGWVITIVIFAWLIITASMFGAEFAHGTMPQLLAQPIDRRRIWREKMIVLAIALASLFLAVVALEASHLEKTATLLLAVVPVCAFCTIPFYSLVGRSTISAVILAIPIPGIIFVVGAAAILWLFRIGALEPTDAYTPINEDRLHFWIRLYFGIALPAYCALLYYLGYRRFLNFEVAGRAQRQIRLPTSLHSGLERIVSCLFPSRLRHLRALVTKELHLQHNGTILFVVFGFLQFLAIAFIKLGHPKDPEPYFTVPLCIYAALMPLVIGSSAIAEETHLGIRAWHLTLPYSARAQWFVKLAVVLIMSALLGIGVPLLWNFVGDAYVGTNYAWSGTDLLTFSCGSLLLTSIAFYASSFSRDTLRALLTAFGLSTALVFTVATIGNALEHSLLITGDLLRPLLKPVITPAIIHILTMGWVVPVLCLIIPLLFAALKHFRTINHHRVWANALLVFVPPIVLFFHVLTVGFAAAKLR